MLDIGATEYSPSIQQLIRERGDHGMDPTSLA